MKDSNILAGNATTKQHQKKILLDANWQYKKDSNMLVGNVNIRQHQRGILLNT